MTVASASVERNMYPAEAPMVEMEAEAGILLSARIHTFPLSSITDIKGNTGPKPETTAAVQK